MGLIKVAESALTSWKIARRLRQSCTRTVIPSGQEREKRQRPESS